MEAGEHLVHAHDVQFCPSLALVFAHPSDPRLQVLERTFERLDLTDLAALHVSVLVEREETFLVCEFLDELCVRVHVLDFDALSVLNL